MLYHISISISKSMKQIEHSATNFNASNLQTKRALILEFVKSTKTSNNAFLGKSPNTTQLHPLITSTT